MKFLILIFFILVTSFAARAQSVWYFGTGEAVNLTNGIKYKNCIRNIAGALDPSTTAVDACSGSMYLSSSGTIYVKQDAGLTTNWLPLGIAAAGSLSTINGQSGPNISIATGSSGSDFNVAAASNTITLNLPSASGSSRGLLTSADWSTFNSKEPAITSGTTSQFWRGDKTFVSVTKTDVGLGNADDTSDANKPVSTAQQAALDLKEDLITATTSADYYRGDKTFQPLNKAAVGLSDVDDTSDADKPVSTAQQAALDLKVDGAASSVDSEVMLYSGTTGKVSKRATGSGYAKLTSGVLSASATVAASDLTGQVALANGGTNKSLTAVAGGVAYTDSDSIEITSTGTSGQVLQSNGSSAPTFVNKSISGKAQSASSVTLEEIQVVNNQLTQTSTNKYLLDNCGDQGNILSNCGFEHSTPQSSWTISPGTPTLDLSDNPQGLKTLQFDPTNEPLEVSQDSTLHATAFSDGIQGLAKCRVKVPTSVSAPIKFAPRKAGAIVSNLEQTVPNTGKWELMKAPFTLGGTSNGVSVHSSGYANITASGIKVDDCSVSAVDLKQDINNVGAWTTGACTSSWTTNTTTTCKYRQVGENLEVEYFWTTTGAPTATALTFGFPSGFTLDTSKTVTTSSDSNLAYGTVTDTGANIFDVVANYNSTSGIALRIINSSSTYASSATSVSNTVPFTWGNTDIGNVKISIPVTQFSGASSVYTAQNADTDWQTCTFSTLAWQGLGTMTGNALECKRQGSDLIMRGSIITGVTAAAQAQLPLPVWNGSQLTVAKSALAGRISRGASAANSTKDETAILTAGNSYMTLGIIEYAVASSPFTSVNGNGAFGTGEIMVFENLRIPITGWTQSNVIIGTFNEVVTTPGVTKPEVFSFGFGGSSLVTACTAGTCFLSQTGTAVTSVTFSSAGVYNLNLSKTYSKISCFGNGYIPATGPALIGDGLFKENVSTFTFVTRRASTETATNSHGTVTCHGYAP